MWHTIPYKTNLWRIHMGELAATNCGCGCENSNNNCLWIILLLLFCNNGSSSPFGGSQDNGCMWIILLLLLCNCNNGCNSLF